MGSITLHAVPFNMFSTYVDKLLNKLISYSCTVHGLSVSALLYADDLVVVSSSIFEMQLMLDVCCNELMRLDLCLNYDKSVTLRIGKGCNKMCCNIKAMGNIIKWITEANYLGIYFRSGKNLSVTLTNKKQNSIGLKIVFLPSLEAYRISQLLSIWCYSITFPILTS